MKPSRSSFALIYILPVVIPLLSDIFLITFVSFPTDFIQNLFGLEEKGVQLLIWAGCWWLGVRVIRWLSQHNSGEYILAHRQAAYWALALPMGSFLLCLLLIPVPTGPGDYNAALPAVTLGIVGLILQAIGWVVAIAIGVRGYIRYRQYTPVAKS